MSSRKLLVLTDGFPHDSWLMTLFRMEVNETEEAKRKRNVRMVQGINLAELEGRV